MITLPKMGTIAQATERYGLIDFAAKHWEEQGLWMKILKVDPAMFPNWKVIGTQIPVHAIYCNKDMAEPLENALFQISARGHGEKLRTFGGCFNIRAVRGHDDRPSAHAYGLAIDINSGDNRLGQSAGGLFDEPDLVQCFTVQGFDWGGNFKTRRDAMHFSFCWEHTS